MNYYQLCGSSRNCFSCYLLVFLSPALGGVLPSSSRLSQAVGLALYLYRFLPLCLSLCVSAYLSVSFPLSLPIPFLQYPIPQFLVSLTSNLYLSDTDVWVFPPCTWNCTQVIIWDSHKLYFICFSFLRDHRPYIFCCLVPKNCCFTLFLTFSFFKTGG